MLNYIFVGVIGLLECFGLALNNKFLQRSKKLPCFISSFINQILWFIVIGIAVSTLNNWGLRLIYALGFASGDIAAILLDKKLEELAKFRGLKLKKKYIHKRRKK